MLSSLELSTKFKYGKTVKCHFKKGTKDNCSQSEGQRGVKVITLIKYYNFHIARPPNTSTLVIKDQNFLIICGTDIKKNTEAFCMNTGNKSFAAA